LKLFDLAKVVHKRITTLLNQKWPVGNIKANSVFLLLVSIIHSFHLGLTLFDILFALLLQSFSVVL